jgi:hypothetical protein
MSEMTMFPFLKRDSTLYLSIEFLSYKCFEVPTNKLRIMVPQTSGVRFASLKKPIGKPVNRSVNQTARFALGF